MEHKILAWEKARKREDSSLLEERIQLSKLEPKGQLWQHMHEFLRTRWKLS